MQQKILIQGARAIVTCDNDDTVLQHADILIEGPEIVKLGNGLDTGDEEIIDGRGKIVYPGLVNTHHHFFQTFVRNLTSIDYPGLAVLDWIRQIYEIFSLVDEEVIYHSTLTAMADLIKHGCTTAFDHQYCYPEHAGKHLVDRQMEAAQRMGIRFIAGRGANTLPGSEGSTVPDEMVETTDDFLSDCSRLIDKYHDPGPFSMRQIVIAPCQPINCHRETFIESAALARSRGTMLHTHLGEGENGPMQERWGKRSLQWCEDIGFVGDDVWFAHGWELQPEEYLQMARTGTGLSHCPAPATLGGFPIIDIPAMEQAGMKLGLGCDGSATNDSSNLLDSLRMAYLMQSYHAKVRGSAPSSYDMLKIATTGGAAIMGRKDVGSLQEGKAADLFLVDAQTLELSGSLHDPANLLARTGLTGPVWLTMINGHVVYQDQMLAGIDECALSAEAEKVCTRVIRERSGHYRNFLLKD